MPGNADYWKYFIVQDMLAVCQIAGCTKPNVSLGPLPSKAKQRPGGLGGWVALL